jgi:hypothetical protein
MVVHIDRCHEVVGLKSFCFALVALGLSPSFQAYRRRIPTPSGKDPTAGGLHCLASSQHSSLQTLA